MSDASSLMAERIVYKIKHWNIVRDGKTAEKELDLKLRGEEANSGGFFLLYALCTVHVIQYHSDGVLSSEPSLWGTDLTSFFIFFAAFHQVRRKLLLVLTFSQRT